MSSIIEQYNSIYKETKRIRDQIDIAESRVEEIRRGGEGDIAERIENLEELIKKIDDYSLKIKGFQELAKKNLDSQNVLTIEAPPNYRVNINRLKDWAMMIDPMSPNDPYAQRVLAVAKCDELFLAQKKKEFIERIAELKDDQASGLTKEMAQLEEKISLLEKELHSIAEGETMRRFADEISSKNMSYWHDHSPLNFSNMEQDVDSISFGAYSLPLGFNSYDGEYMKKLFSQFYDSKRGNVLIPVEIPFGNEFVLAISCSPSRTKELDKGLQNLIINLIGSRPAGMHKINVFDGVRFNTYGIGSLKQIEGSFVLNQVPRNQEQLTTQLEGIVSAMSDIDEIIELYDSVHEYNQNVEKSVQLPTATMIIYGWPTSFSGREKELLNKIITNYERYGFSIITVNYRSSEDKDDERFGLPEYALYNSIRVKMDSKGTFIKHPNSEERRFVWYSFNGALTPEYASQINNLKLEDKTVGNEYIKRYPIDALPPYTREYKKMELPFGIDGKDIDHSISFENENFAAYLVGASRSGKSTLLHTLIAGIIRNYHPDNVELWLADFKQLEFKRYMKHMPPHVKYILLDESRELVFDLIDKLTAEMMERQKLFSRLGKQRLDQIDPTTLDKPLPIIFVILDEFSIMSQSIAESDIYKLRLQNLLAKGAALGFKFLFSSQTFTTGVAGLTATARAQIQQRIAMKGSKEEISETLELSANLKTDQVRNWMDALPPHYALVKFRMDADTPPQVKRFLVMYFKDYEPRDAMIDSLNLRMIASEVYKPNEINTYVNKSPVRVDGNTFDAYETKNLTEAFEYENKSNDEVVLSFGTPRLMTSVKPVIVSAETRENILLIARTAEQDCNASILLSIIKDAQAQNVEIEIWAYSKNRLYQEYKNVFLRKGITLREDIDDVCVGIKEIKNTLDRKVFSNKLILLIGMDRIVGDFEFVDDGTVSGLKTTTVLDQIKRIENASGDISVEEEMKRVFAQRWIRLEKEIRKKYAEKPDIENIVGRERINLADEIKREFNVEVVNEGESRENDMQKREEVKTDSLEGSAYNAFDDFVQLVKQGSRGGTHFVLSLNSVADMKPMGMKPDYFRHKMAFQLSADDSRTLFGSKIASGIPEHICLYDDSLESFSFRPYIHEGISWEGWFIDENGVLFNPYGDSDE